MASLTIQQATDLAIHEHREGRLARAEQMYRQILTADSAYIPALANLAVLLGQVGKLPEAQRLWHEVVRLEPANAYAHERLGTTLGMQGKLHECVASLRTAVQLKPDFGQAYSNLGNALRQMGEVSESADMCRRAIELDPADPSAHSNLGAALQETGKLDEAIDCYRKAIELAPEAGPAHFNLALALWLKGRRDEALQSARRAHELSPQSPEVHNLLAELVAKVGELSNAETSARTAIRLKADFADPHNVLAMVLQAQGRADEAIAEARRAVELAPSVPRFHSDLLFWLHYIEQPDRKALFEEHLAWARRHVTFEPRTDHRNDRSPDRSLRIGYISPDFRIHPVMYFFQPILERHDRSQFEVFCYSNNPALDEVSHRFQQRTDHWRDIWSMNDDLVSALVIDDRIDILIDLAGHTGHGRPLVMARKPAPVQVTYLGYPDTTGLSTVDYRLTDALVDPPGLNEPFCTERLLRLPKCAWCYRPGVSPALEPKSRSTVTFGSFNNLGKVNRQWIGVWCQILRAVTDSRMILKSPSFRDERTRQHIHSIFQQHGVQPDRVDVLGPHSHPADHLATYQQVDIALDTFPYHGTTTTCESLWMGVPVVTLADQAHVSRVGASLLSMVALGDLVTSSAEAYVEAATALAHDQDRRHELRRALRDRMRESPLMDECGFVHAYEQLLRDGWVRWAST